MALTDLLIRGSSVAVVVFVVSSTLGVGLSLTVGQILAPLKNARTKFAARDSTTSRAFLSGARIWPTVRLRPTPSVLDTTKTTTATLEPRISRSVSAIVAAFRHFTA